MKSGSCKTNIFSKTLLNSLKQYMSVCYYCNNAYPCKTDRPAHAHTLKRVYIRDVGIYIHYISRIYIRVCITNTRWKRRGKKSLVRIILPRLYRYYVGARTSTSADCVRRLPAAAEDHIAGRCAERKGGKVERIRRGDECATKPVDRIGRTRQFTYWPGPRRAVAHKIRAHLSQAFTAAAASVAVWLPAIRMGIHR